MLCPHPILPYLVHVFTKLIGKTVFLLVAGLLAFKHEERLGLLKLEGRTNYFPVSGSIYMLVVDDLNYVENEC